VGIEWVHTGIGHDYMRADVLVCPPVLSERVAAAGAQMGQRAAAAARRSLEDLRSMFSTAKIYGKY